MTFSPAAFRAFALESIARVEDSVISETRRERRALSVAEMADFLRLDWLGGSVETVYQDTGSHFSPSGVSSQTRTEISS
jgi:hypothetical protein